MGLQLFDPRQFEGQRYDAKASFRSIADEWSATYTGKKRESVATVVQVDGYTVSKWSHDTSEAEAAGAGKRVKKQRVDVPRDTACIVCAKGGRDLVYCSVAACQRVMHKSCLKELAIGAPGFAAKCPQHACTVCLRGVSNSNGLLFRCAQCPTTLCSDCLPKEEGFAPVDRARMMEKLGYIPAAYEYIMCGNCAPPPPPPKKARPEKTPEAKGKGAGRAEGGGKASGGRGAAPKAEDRGKAPKGRAKSAKTPPSARAGARGQGAAPMEEEPAFDAEAAAEEEALLAARAAEAAAAHEEAQRQRDREMLLQQQKALLERVQVEADAQHERAHANGVGMNGNGVALNGAHANGVNGHAEGEWGGAAHSACEVRSLSADAGLGDFFMEESV